MQKLIRTSITIPEDIYKDARVVAAKKSESLSKFITQSIRIRMYGKAKPKKKTDPTKILGKYSLGGKEPYKHRSELYDEHLKRKMGY